MVDGKLLTGALGRLQGFGMAATLRVAHRVLQQATQHLCTLAGLREAADQLDGCTVGQVFMFRNSTGLIFGQVAIVETILERNHVLSS